MAEPPVVVIGAGLSGLACAFRLAEAGIAVSVLETKPYVGGRTSSWSENGMAVESGFHRFRGIYTALPRLLHDAGIDVERIVSWQTTCALRVPGQGAATFGIAPWHDPAATLRGLWRSDPYLKRRDKLSLLPLVLAGVIRHARRPQDLDRLSVSALLQLHPPSDRAREHVVRPLTRGIFFRPRADYSAYAFMMPLAFSLRRFAKMRSGVFRGGMTEVMTQPLADAIGRRKDCGIRTGCTVEALLVEAGRVSGVRTEIGTLAARHVVLATPVGPAQALLDASALAPAFPDLLKLGTTPSVTLHLELDAPCLAEDHPVFAPGTPLICFAEQSRTTFPGSKGRLSIVLSPSEEFISLSPPEILARVVSHAAAIGLPLEDRILDYRAVAMPADFYAAAPGHDRLRPEQRTQVPGLTLAGDYTRQPFLSTMEGAVIAGENAAKVVLGKS